MSDVIRCPNCQSEVQVTEVLARQLRAQLQGEFDLLQHKQLAEIERREAAVLAQKKSLQSAEAELNERVAQRVEQARNELLAKARIEARDAIQLELADAKSQLGTVKNQLVEAQQAEFAARRERQKLEDEKRQLDLTILRRVDEERQKTREQTRQEVADQFQRREQDLQLKLSEKDKTNGDLKQQIDELQRKSTQGSQTLQGEVLELELETVLTRAFPQDSIEPVPIGVRGADVIQKVVDGTGRKCGLILWESKRTKNWNQDWLAKLREDQRVAGAEAAVLVSVELPKEISSFSLVDGIWVTSWKCAAALAGALRVGLMRVTEARQVSEGRHDKMEVLYNYLAGPQFRQLVEGIAEAFNELHADLQKEKSALQRMWAKREKQLELALKNTVTLHGDLSGIIGKALPEIEPFALPSPENDDEDRDPPRLFATEPRRRALKG